MKNITHIILVFGLVAGLVTGVASFAALAQNLSPEKNAIIQNSIEKVKKAVEQAGSEFKEIQTLLGKLKVNVEAISGDMIELKSEASILKKGKYSTDLLRLKLDRINTQLADAQSKRDEIIVDLVAMYDAIAGLRQDQRNDPHGFLLKLITTLNDQIGTDHIAETEKSLADDSAISLVSALIPFYNQLAKFNVAVGADNINRDVVTRMTLLTKTVAGLSAAQISALEKGNAASGALVKALSAKFNDAALAQAKPAVGAITIAATALTAALPDKTKGGKVLQQVLIGDPKASKALVDLEAALDIVGLQDAGLVVRITHALYGDTPIRWKKVPVNGCKTVSGKKTNCQFRREPIVNHHRWCDATTAMRGLCDRKNGCKLLPAHNTTACGYDPAPSADPRNRGIYVKYECVPNIEDKFTGHYNRRSRKPREHTHPVGSALDYVVLRTGGNILCSAVKG